MGQRDIHDRPDWYAVLGVESSATFVEIRAAYRRHALALHAERLHSAETPPTLVRAYDRLHELSDAYRTLRHPDTRRAYDLVREGRSSSVLDPAREARPAPPRYATRARQYERPERDRRRLGRIGVVLGFGLLVLWAVLASIAERRQAEASILSNPSGIATAPASER